jgi:hypothetical protein
MCKKLICLLTVLLFASSASAATLVLDWQLDGNFNDSSGNSYNANQGSGTPTTSRHGIANQAMSMGAGDYATGWGFVGGSVGDIPCKVGEAFSINVWAKMTFVEDWWGVNAKALCMSGFGDPTDSTQGSNRFLGLESATVPRNQPGTAFLWGELADYDSTTQATLHIWQMYTLVCDGTNQATIYLSNWGDSTPTLAGSGTTNDGTNPVNLTDSCYMVHLAKASGEGSYAPASWAYDFQGDMDDYKIYRGQLTIGEITHLLTFPEPATIALLGLGGLALLRRRR